MSYQPPYAGGFPPPGQYGGGQPAVPMQGQPYGPASWDQQFGQPSGVQSAQGMATNSLSPGRVTDPMLRQAVLSLIRTDLEALRKEYNSIHAEEAGKFLKFSEREAWKDLRYSWRHDDSHGKTYKAFGLMRRAGRWLFALRIDKDKSWWTLKLSSHKRKTIPLGKARARIAHSDVTKKKAVAHLKTVVDSDAKLNLLWEAGQLQNVNAYLPPPQPFDGGQPPLTNGVDFNPRTPSPPASHWGYPAPGRGGYAQGPTHHANAYQPPVPPVPATLPGHRPAVPWEAGRERFRMPSWASPHDRMGREAPASPRFRAPDYRSRPHSGNGDMSERSVSPGDPRGRPAAGAVDSQRHNNQPPSPYTAIAAAVPSTTAPQFADAQRRTSSPDWTPVHKARPRSPQTPGPSQ